MSEITPGLLKKKERKKILLKNIIKCTLQELSTTVRLCIGPCYLTITFTNYSSVRVILFYFALLNLF